MILFLPLFLLPLDVVAKAIGKGSRQRPKAKHESGSLKAELSLLLRRSELLLFARAKRSNQEKHAPASAPSVPTALRVHSAAGIFRRDIHVSSKNDVHPCTSPLRGLVRRLRRCGRGPESQLQRQKQNHNNNNNNRRPADVPKKEEPLARLFPLHRAMYPIRPDRSHPPAAPPPCAAPPTGGTRTRPAPAHPR